MSDDDVLTEVKFWSLLIEDSRQTVFVNPELESRVKTWVDARGLRGIVTVVANRYVPENKVYVAKAAILGGFL